MTYAPKVEPVNSFADDESNQAAGRSTVRTVQLDVNLANFASAFNELNANVKKLQRDDDKLRDFIVAPYTLSESLRAMLATAGVTIRGTWKPFTQYVIKDLIQRNGVAYICQTAHNSGPAWNLGFWIAISGDGSAQAWAEQAQDNANAASDSAEDAATASAIATAAAAEALVSKLAAAASELAAQNAADSIAGLSPVSLTGFMLDFLGNNNASSALSDLGAVGVADLAATNGAGMVGADLSLAYPPGSVGALLKQSVVQLEWFGNSWAAALAALPSGGGTIILADNAVYPPPGNNLMGRHNITIRGTRRPSFKPDFSGLENGSIVRGPFPFRGDNVTLENFGVDSGASVCASLYGGTAQEGFLAGLPVATRSKRLVARNLVAICKEAGALTHAAAFEGYENAEVHGIDVVFGVHGIALKMSDSNVSNLRTRGCGFNGVVIKSDTAQTTSERLNVTNVVCESVGTYDGGGLRITNAAGGQSLVGINIKNVVCSRTKFGVEFDCNDTHLIDSVHIDGLFMFVCQNFGFQNIGQARRCTVSNAVAYNCGTQGFLTAKAVGPGSGTSQTEVDFTNCVAANCATGFDLYGRNVLSQCRSTDNALYGYFAEPGSRVSRISCSAAGNGTADFGPVGSAIWYPGNTNVPVQTPALTNGWVNYGGASQPAGFYTTDDGVVYLTGMVKSGALGASCMTLPVGYRPPAELWFACSSLNGSTLTTTHVVVQANGTVVPQLAGGNAFLSLDGISFRMDLT